MLPTITHPILDSIEDFLYTYLNEKSPHIPGDAKETIIKYLPYAVILLIIAQISMILLFFGINTIFGGLGYLYSTNIGLIGIIGLIIMSVAIIFEAFSLPLLFKHSRYGWRLFLYAVLIVQINELINLNIINIIFSGVISLYILLQVREHYR